MKNKYTKLFATLLFTSISTSVLAANYIVAIPSEIDEVDLFTPTGSHSYVKSVSVEEFLPNNQKRKIIKNLNGSYIINFEGSNYYVSGSDVISDETFEKVDCDNSIQKNNFASTRGVAANCLQGD